MDECQFADGEVIFRQGDASEEAYLIRAGRVEVAIDLPHGMARLAILGEGDILGEMGLLDERPRSATATAMGPVRADVVGKSEFLSMIADDPGRALELLRAIFERLRTMNQIVARSEPVPAEWALPRVVLLPRSVPAKAAIPGSGIEVSRFPFRIGRKPAAGEENVLAFNDIELKDEKPYTVSLNHIAIDLGSGGVVARDRGSRLGSLVNGARIGTLDGLDAAPLHDGENELILGGAGGHFGAPRPVYKFAVLVEAA